MIDHLDKQTQPLPLEQKRGRGRPATGQALSNADRQRAYRERQKAQRNERSENHPVPYDEVVAIAQELGERCKKAEARVKELEKQLAQRDEKPKKTYVCAIQKKSPKGQWRTVCKYETQMEGNTAYLEVCEGEMAHLYRIINLK